ncbi:hypothetical protein J6590_062658 [Homalodisca vitripennis]|nr:hypothetical protein J6590_062658 [Homalodisca vitripennis]
MFRSISHGRGMSCLLIPFWRLTEIDDNDNKKIGLLKMPTLYKRKPGAKPRGQWNPEREVINRIQAGDISFREAERYYGVPVRTIKRRMQSGKTDSPGHGPSCSLGPDNELRLVKHIEALGDAGFCPDQTTVRKMAYEFAVALRINHKFNNEKKLPVTIGSGRFLDVTLI